jgi:hypothetical protein
MQETPGNFSAIKFPGRKPLTCRYGAEFRKKFPVLHVRNPYPCFEETFVRMRKHNRKLYGNSLKTQGFLMSKTLTALCDAAVSYGELRIPRYGVEKGKQVSKVSSLRKPLSARNGAVFWQKFPLLWVWVFPTGNWKLVCTRHEAPPVLPAWRLSFEA